jgi:NAD(P)-dependent dehydrogenase (short-subunit alcohol dehydrogenase family)
MPGAANMYRHHRRKNDPVPCIFIAGSTDGLGRAAAGVLLEDGHDVVLHARTRERAAALGDLARTPRESSSATSAAQPRPESSPVR